MSVQPMPRAVSGNFSIAGFLSQCDSKQKTRQSVRCSCRAPWGILLVGENVMMAIVVF